MAKVVLKNVSKNFGKKEILKNIDLEIKDGEFCVLVGASGCGKSTLLRMIAGLEHQNEGDIYIGSDIVNNIEPKDRNVAMVFQSYALYPHLSVFDNIALSLKVKKIATCEIHRRVSRACEILQIEDLLKRKPKELSGGQRQRVALARAIVRQPRVFLMDEPLSNLDAKLRNQMRSEIKKLHKKLGITFVYVTHDQTEALTMGDKIVVLNNGKIEQIDTPYNIYNHPQSVFVGTFMGVNPMNIVEANVKDGFLTFANITVSLNSLPALLQNNQKLYLGIRPEDIVCEANPSYHFNTIKFEAKINFEENLGSSKNLYFNLGENNFISSVNAQVPTSEKYKFSINPKDFHFFDYATQKPLRLKESYIF